VVIKYCPTEDMLADYMTKPLTGSKFNTFWNIIMNKAMENKNINGNKIGNMNEKQLANRSVLGEEFFDPCKDASLGKVDAV
jgi:hypothetical protein